MYENDKIMYICGLWGHEQPLRPKIQFQDQGFEYEGNMHANILAFLRIFLISFEKWSENAGYSASGLWGHKKPARS